MPQEIPPFQQGVLEQVAKGIGGLYSGTELTRIMAQVPLKDDPGEGYTKWRRVAVALAELQNRTQNGKGTVRLINIAMGPDRTIDRKAAADVVRDELQQVLSLAGLKVLETGAVARTSRATTDTDAIARTKRLSKLLETRGTHPQVLLYGTAVGLADSFGL